jgi:sigma-54-specific transcriptional regulator
VATLHIPPLRERRLDIAPLAQHFLKIYAERLGLKDPVLNPEAAEVLVTQHSWPGNIRELENVIHHALLVCRENIVRPEDLHLSSLKNRAAVNDGKDSAADLHQALLAMFESDHPNLYATIDAMVIKAAYEFCHRNQLQTAKLLGISRNILRARLIEYGELPKGR